MTASPPKNHAAWKVALGPLLAGAVLLAGPGEDPAVARMAAIAVWMATWWATEAVAIPVTSLLPLVLVPLAGILPAGEVAPVYTKPVIFLFLGGFLLALGLQASGAHRRVALAIVHAMGGAPRRIVLGFMLASAFLSMWISNTATVMVLMPIALSVLAAASGEEEPSATLRTFGVALMLGIAYAADIGGMATLVGTPPNLVYKQALTEMYPAAPSPDFGSWMRLGLPLSAVFLVSGWLLLTRVIFRSLGATVLGGREAVAALRRGLGPLRRDELVASAVFAVTALLWITRKDLELGGWTLPGWESAPWLVGKGVDDAVVAIGMAIVMFLVPSQDRPGERLLEWRMAREVPWGMLLLFGGGFALARGFEESGLSLWLASLFEGVDGRSNPWVLVAVLCFVITFVTELTSNTATTQIVLPVLKPAALGLGLDPRLLMIPAVLSASCAFMMPVASPTQAIVFASGWVPIRQMIRAGIWFNLLGVTLVLVVFWLFGGAAMGIDPEHVPAWAR